MHEFQILKKLSETSSHAPGAVEFFADSKAAALVAKEEGFQPLSKLLLEKPIELSTFYTIAIKLSHIVSEIHKESVIHKNLTSETIYFNSDTEDVKVWGLSIASKIKRTLVPPEPPRFLQGNLNYIAPEQTGRMNRPITFKSDLYSLGVIFYELLTGTLPFDAKESMTIIFGHLAKIPPEPHEIRKEVPVQLSKIVMKLLSKSSDDRYKSALGLEKDLTIVSEGLLHNQRLDDFVPGAKDISFNLEMPDELYGRETEKQTLFRIFDQVSETGESTLVTVVGYSGVGKTSLVNEMMKKITLANGLFAGGSFSAFKQSDSYDGLRKAFNRLVHYHLGLPQEEYEDFKQRLLEEVGVLLPLLTEFIPSLKHIFDDLAPLPETGIREKIRRFEIAVERFIKVISEKRTLVLFLDDLQWGRESLFELLTRLVINSEIKNIMIIASYRANEVGHTHPIRTFLAKLEERKRLCSIHLEGLKESSIREMLADMLSLPKSEVGFFAEILEKKTDGNPFFLLMFLEELYSNGLLFFSTESQCWKWEESAVSEIPAMENVVELVKKRLDQLSEESRSLLQIAACFGPIFSLQHLCLYDRKDPSQVFETLKPAINEGFILPYKMSDEWIVGASQKQLSYIKWRFQHDKILESCYQLEPLEKRKQIHLTLARHWYDSEKKNLTSDTLLGIVGQYNKALDFISDTEEKRLVCRLNYQAGRTSEDSFAYDAAYNFDTVSKKYLSEEIKQSDYAFAFAVYYNYIKSSYMVFHYDESRMAARELFNFAKTDLDKVKVLNLSGDLARAVKSKESATEFYEQALRLLGYPKVAKKPTLFDLVSTMIRMKLLLRFYGNTIDELPEKETQEFEYLIQLADRLAEESYYSGDVLRFIYVLVSICVFSFFKQTRVQRMMTLSVTGMIYPHNETYHSYSLESFEYLKNAKKSFSIASNMFASAALHFGWHKAWKDLVSQFQLCARKCEEVGNFEFMGQALFYVTSFHTTLSCKESLIEYTKTLDLVKEISPRGLLMTQIYHQLYRNLTGECPLNTWQDEQFDENKIHADYNKLKFQLGKHRLYICKVQFAVHGLGSQGDISDIKELRACIPAIIRSNNAKDALYSHVYLFMAEIQHLSDKTLWERIKNRRFLHKLCRRVKSWIRFCPENFEHGYVLMKAELAHYQGHFKKALNLYIKAMRLARKNKMPEFQALAAKRALQLCLKFNEEDRAKRYYEIAIDTYKSWEAAAIVEVLKEQYGEYFEIEETGKRQEPAAIKKQDIDARSISLAADVLSKEIHLEGLLKNIMQLLSENVGATKSALLLIENRNLWVEGYFDSKNSEVQTLTHQSWEEANLPEAVIRQTWREKKEIFELNTHRSELDIEDYTNESGAKCLISVPIVKEDKVIGIIYCENNISANAFTEDRLDILRALSLQMSISVENSRLYTTFEKFVPKHFLNQLGVEYIFDIKEGNSVLKEMNVLFIDIRNFTGFAEANSVDETFGFISKYFAAVTPVIHRGGGFVDKFLGDGVMTFFPVSSEDCLRTCLEIQRVAYNFSKKMNVDFDMKLGMGMHYGPLMLGVVGEASHIEGTVIGDTVNVAARLESLNKAYGTQCLISDVIKDNLEHPEDFDLRPVGKVKLIGRKEPVLVWEVLDVILNEHERTPFLETKGLFEESYNLYLNRDFEKAMQGFDRVLEKNPNDKTAAFYLSLCQTYRNQPLPQDWSGEVTMTIK